MPILSITPDIDKAPWRDLTAVFKTHGLGTITRIGRLPNGTTGGKSTVSIIVEMPNGDQYAAQTTLALLCMAVDAMKAVDDQAKTQERN